MSIIEKLGLSATPSLIDHAAMVTWVVLAAVLFLKMYTSSLVQIVARFRHRAFVLPDNARFFAHAAPVAEDVPIAQIATGCWRNDLENIPMFLFMALGYVLAGGHASWLQLYGIIFVAARVMHTIFYFALLQPFRALAYGTGVCVIFVLAAHDLVLVAG